MLKLRDRTTQLPRIVSFRPIERARPANSHRTSARDRPRAEQMIYSLERPGLPRPQNRGQRQPSLRRRQPPQHTKQWRSSTAPRRTPMRQYRK